MNKFADTQARPISSAVLDEAIEWQLLLDSGEASAAERVQWQEWIEAHPDHARVWQQLQVLDGELSLIAGAPVRTLVEGSRKSGVPKVLGSLALVTLLTGAGLAALNTQRPVTGLFADYATKTGEQQHITLPDNTLLILNSRTAVDIEFTRQQRVIRLRTGDILVQSGHPAGEQRPLMVITAEGSMRALGTAFVVQRENASTRLDVTEAAVLARAANCDAAVNITNIASAACTAGQRVDEGYGIQLSDGVISAPQQSAAGVDAWRSGLLVFNDRPLAEVAAELARYKTGFITVAPEVAQVRVTASLPLNSPDLALTALADALPIRLSTRIGFWTHIEPAKK